MINIQETRLINFLLATIKDDKNINLKRFALEYNIPSKSTIIDVLFFFEKFHHLTNFYSSYELKRRNNISDEDLRNIQEQHQKLISISKDDFKSSEIPVPEGDIPVLLSYIFHSSSENVVNEIINNVNFDDQVCVLFSECSNLNQLRIIRRSNEVTINFLNEVFVNNCNNSELWRKTFIPFVPNDLNLGSDWFKSKCTIDILLARLFTFISQAYKKSMIPYEFDIKDFCKFIFKSINELFISKSLVDQIKQPITKFVEIISQISNDYAFNLINQIPNNINKFQIPKKKRNLSKIHEFFLKINFSQYQAKQTSLDDFSNNYLSELREDDLSELHEDDLSELREDDLSELREDDI